MHQSGRVKLVGVLVGVALVGCGDDGTGATTATTAVTSVTTTSVGSSSSTTDASSSTTDGSSGSGSASMGNTTSGSTSETTSGTTGGSTGSTGGSTTDTTTGGVLPCTDADCPMGQFCDAQSGECMPGCNDDADCMAPTKCDVNTNTCKGCLIDGDCPLGTVCTDGECTPGCNDMQPCQDGLACCTETCIDLLTDLDNCGGCGVPCAAFPNADPVCDGGACVFGPCKAGYADCDKSPMNGCEVKGACACDPGSTIECFTGDDVNKNVGICKTGLATCNAMGTGYGACVGEVLPNMIDVCSNGKDDNCNGQVDEDPDLDKDGWTVCQGDCCDAVGPNCLNPELVNPGAFEVPSNMVDDDCDMMIDNPVALCGGGLASNSSNALDYAKAIDLCQTTTENPPLNQKKWGVISGSLTRANGAGTPYANSKSIRPGFGTNITPQLGTNIAVLSTGGAADLNDVNPAYQDFQIGVDTATNSPAPADWLAAHGNVFPNAPGCPAAGSNQAYNSIQLRLRVRVPTNAKSFNVQMFFFSSEWPEWTCTPYNDMFVTLVDSAGAGNPADKNIAIYKTMNNQIFPVGVNLVKAANGLFTQCKNGTFGCSGLNGGTYNGCTGTNLLAGTGFDIVEGGCGTNNTTGGGTGWLKMSGNVKGGETMEIRFDIWDTSDGVYDSLVLLDAWQWSVQASQPGVIPN
ncbi:MAG TPA: choice-of-anchor L domain-containing protein [Nannocystaceae bacterium]|nr:choice-of-anchor L domain-containing protein [Nannocystaceae bacterium]